MARRDPSPHTMAVDWLGGTFAHVSSGDVAGLIVRERARERASVRRIVRRIVRRKLGRAVADAVLAALREPTRKGGGR